MKKSNIDEAKEIKIKHENLNMLEQLYNLAHTMKEPMEKLVDYAVQINELRFELQIPKLDFKKELKYLKKHVKVLSLITNTGEIIKNK